MPGKTAVSMPFTRDVGVESQMRFEDTLLACTADYTPDWSKDPSMYSLWKHTNPPSNTCMFGN